MADKLHFSLVSPEREILSADVDQVDVPGVEGMIGVLPDHAPFMTVLAPGFVSVRTGSEEKRFFVLGGFAEITPAGLTLLAEQAVAAEELTKDFVNDRVKMAEEALEKIETEETRILAEQALGQLKDVAAQV